MKPCYREYFPSHLAPQYTDVPLQYPIKREDDLSAEKPG